jgi:hypothetical protein
MEIVKIIIFANGVQEVTGSIFSNNLLTRQPKTPESNKSDLTTEQP